MTLLALALLLLAPWATPSQAAPASPANANVFEVTIDGASQRVLFVTPERPAAVVVMFPGGDGIIGITADGTIAKRGNFLIRTRPNWLAQGFAFAAVDAARSRAGRNGDRVGKSNQRAIAAIVAEIRKRTDAPIWLLGTSAGAPAAVAGAASLSSGAIRGVVISSPVSAANSDTVFDVSLKGITVPVLIQVHKEDGCPATPPRNAARIKSALSASPDVEIQEFTGGRTPQSVPCEAFAQHGFFGIEDQVVAAAAAWIKQR